MKRFLTDYRRRAGLLIAVLLCVCIGSTAGLSYWIISDHLDAEVKRTNLSLLLEVDSKLTLVLRAIDKETIGLLQSKEVWEFMERDFSSPYDYSAFMIGHLSPRLNGMLGSNEHVLSIDLYSYARQRLSAGNVSDASGSLPGDYGWVQDFEKSGALVYWMNTRLLRNNLSGSYGTPVITLVRSYPMLHADGYRKGAAAVNIRESYIYDLIQSAVASNSGEIYLINAEGTIVSHPDKRRLGQPGDSDPVLSQAVRGQREGAATFAADGAGSSVFYTTSPYTGWKLVSVVPELQLNKGMVQVRNLLLAICIALVGCALLLALAANRWTLKPVNRLVRNLTNSLQTHRLYERREGTEAGLVQLERSVSHLIEDSERMFRQVAEYKPTVRWRLAMELLTGIRKHPEPLQALNAIGCRLSSSAFVVIGMEFDRKQEDLPAEQMYWFNYALSNVAEELVNAEVRGISIELDHRQTAAIISFEESEEDKPGVARTIAEQIRRYAETHFKRTVTIGIGKVVDTPEHIHRSYRDASEALKYKIGIGPNAIITIEDVKEQDGFEFYRLLGRTDGILAAVKAADRDKAEALARAWLAELSGWKTTTDSIRQLAVQAVYRIMAMLGEMDVRMPQQEERLLFGELDRSDSVRQLERCLIGLLEEAVQRIEAKRNNRERHEVVDRMLAFIQIHYGRSDLSLNLLADQYKMSVYHLSRIFKEQTGGNFLDHVMRLRMEKAKALLRESEQKIGRIAEEVGYTNLNSFVRIFKKSTGFTPTEYRELETEKAARAATTAKN
ncbi:helix-turn-helix domain-containing protein [Paenibacillus oceani]|uniref:AraC family transcriptional regulator n=1 Tax=Paenibacillus oceani TaxID=2772510 RepID=A0A927CG80_9BACL|nr:helix-turn-helix domain-containing protein [Paenibacillus oceani]MBD2865641.1 AraC family transcriptional regulator [Paenibacillus oceani]